ncbi:hypothetical protein PAMP_004094 [Pampus punctatissimus]
MASKLDLPLHGSSLNIVKRCGPTLSNIIQSKFGCVPTFNGVDFESDWSIGQQKKPTVVPEKRAEVTLHAGVRVSVWKGDLTNFPVAAVVNAANTRLQHCGGLALALSMAGGPQIQKDSNDYIKKYGELKTGHALVADSGLLPCQKIIHAVGPCLPNHPPSAEIQYAKSQLEQTIRSILDKVKETRLQSVAIPAISSGLFNFPLQLCADTIVTTVKRYYENHKGYCPQDVFLVNNDEPSVKEMERAFHHIFLSYSQAITRSSKGAAEMSTPTVKMGNVCLKLKRGNIEQQQTDVIVNTISASRNLSIGQISTALLMKAGPAMQNEIYQAPLTGSIIITLPHRLQCKEVYHTCCTDKSNIAAQKILFDSVLECLWTAASRKHRSIAFPAIGTGALGYNKKEVAYIMSDAVICQAQNFPEMMEVHFVIFPSEEDTFQAFEEVIKFLQRKYQVSQVSEASVSHELRHEGDFREKRAPAPQISLNGPSDEATREADRWLSNLLYVPSNTVVISNNFIQYFGEQEYLQLSRLTKEGVQIEDCFENGHTTVTVHGDSAEDVAVAGLQVEAILCKVQSEFVAEEESRMRLMSTQNVSFERKTVNRKSREFSDRENVFRNQGLQILKVDKVENLSLTTLFDLKKRQLDCSNPKTMFQRIPAHFCEMVSHIGFHTEYAPPHEIQPYRSKVRKEKKMISPLHTDPAYGEGIYFAGTVKAAMEVWKEQKEEYLYFVEAEVLTGKAARGKRGLILPPPVGTDPNVLHDSVYGEPDVSVIFSGYQALPKYIITCKKV